MIYRQLGRTDLYVSLLSFGSHTDPRFKVKAGDHNILNQEGQQRRDRLIASALDLGVNMVDTYENEGQWEPVARVVRGRRDKTLISVCRQFPMFVGENIDRAAKLYGHVDLYRIYVGGDKLTDENLADWDVLRRAKEAGKVRAIGISTHSEPIMLDALRELEGIDYFMFPYNFIHARADYSEFLPAAAKAGVGMIAIKPLAAGSIVKLDPSAQEASTQPERDFVQLYQEKYRPILPSIVVELTKSLERLPGESLCQAALRFVYSRPFMTCAMPGMFEQATLADNHAGLTRYLDLTLDERAALDAAGKIAKASRRAWLPAHYRWLEERWLS